MKRPHSIFMAIVVLVLFAGAAGADPGATWEKQIAGASRFTVLSQFGGAAVLDKETGRVWQQSPENEHLFSWFAALTHCYQLQVGGRKGWRLPSIEEVASLVDTLRSNPSLPVGHPFTHVESGVYWSSTTLASDGNFAWWVEFGLGNVSNTFNKEVLNFAWCVRGGQGIDGVQGGSSIF